MKIDEFILKFLTQKEHRRNLLSKIPDNDGNVDEEHFRQIEYMLMSEKIARITDKIVATTEPLNIIR